MSMMNNQYKQFIQTIKNQYNKIKSLENELIQCNANLIKSEQNLILKVKEIEENIFTCKNTANEKINEMTNELAVKSNQLECANEKINEMTNELAVKSNQLESQLECANEKINEMTNELAVKSNQLESQLECANEKINEMTNELAVKSNQLEYANEKINEMTVDLDKRNDTIYQIDKIILRNNDYFDEVKKELNDKITCGKEMAEMYQKTNDELLIVRNEMELLHKELDETKKELQLYKNDFILRSATF
jgi:chromosome segregation ATPase